MLLREYCLSRALAGEGLVCDYLLSEKLTYCKSIFVNNQLDAQLFFLYLFIPVLYMFRATKCWSSVESIVSIRPLVYVTVCR